MKFLLPESQNIFFDKRLLTARSEYFAEMFCQPAWREARTNEVDMSSDEDATVRSVKALCVYLMADTFHAEGDIELALSVRRLADRYRLTGLVEKTEQELELMLCADNALSFLATVTGTGGHLEQACLALIEADNCELLEQQHPSFPNSLRLLLGWLPNICICIYVFILIRIIYIYTYSLGRGLVSPYFNKIEHVGRQTPHLEHVAWGSFASAPFASTP